jgi:hypothetical protein
MKSTLILVFAFATIALGTFCVVQSHKLATLRTETASLRAKADLQVREIADLQSSQKFLRQQSQDLFDQSSQLASKLVALQRTNAQLISSATSARAGDNAGASARGDKNPFGQFLSKMMDDPDMKKMIRDQQRAMMDKLYEPLMKEMAMQPEEAARFKDFLADNMIKNTERATALMGDGSSTNRIEALSKLTAEQKEFDAQLKEMLGESRYAQYKDYQETLGERTQLQQFQQQYAGSGNALSDQQTAQLLALMREEKMAAMSGGGFGQSQDAASIQAMMSGEALEKMMQSQETASQRVYERARGVLSEEQLAAFGRFQTNQIQMMRVGMSMARKFLTPDGSQGSGTTPTP